ncbi:LodA/GoxA family CTQ-dependent oxidase [Kitasatospora sp. NPDC057015]|uniref:LodA/GoxA family CTQ-dependent oxidase n=1 Tax=Kitasatospora sp. NPDC057015 TaxID=3346001 RepID=UPI003626C5BB
MGGDGHTFRIHPAIGIARVGNSEEDFVGPEVPDRPPAAPGGFKDAEGRIKRQAARFRIYAYDADGAAVREVVVGRDGVRDVSWTVHLANKKAAWYQFYVPLDVPDGRRLKQRQYGRRNAGFQGDREALVIDPGPRTVSAGERQQERISGQILGQKAHLGDLRGEAAGSLLVLGGRGAAGSWADPPRPITGIANNDTWFDDVSDGPVTARIVLDDGGEIEATGAWAVVAPPDYAPAVRSIRTLHDLLLDVFVGNGTLPAPAPVTYAGHIEPILARFCGLQWVNRGFAAQFGWGAPNDFLAPAMRARLADPLPRNREFRTQIYNSLRDYDRDGRSPAPWPWIYGDGMAVPPRSDLQHLALTTTQNRLLEEWAAGRFTPGTRTTPDSLADAPVADRPGLLDRAALEACAADAFHPGCEVTWPVRHDTMYTEPFRIRHRTAQDGPEPDYGPLLTPEIALSVHGPLYAQGPGDLTRWMAAPWQTDTAGCRSGYELADNVNARYSPYLPTFWPAQVPNQVLKETDFVLVNAPGDDEARADAFERRAVWLRGLTATDKIKQLQQMTETWWKFGIVEERSYDVGDERFPRTILVESTPAAPLDQAPDHHNLINVHVPQAGVPGLSEAAAGAALDRAVEVALEGTAFRAEDVSAGYLEKVDPFQEWQ